ncbi:MAG: hypothetical protein ACXWWL_05645 [Candidatus Limnocylindria bacterium]
MSERLRLLARGAPLALVLLLGIGWLLPEPDGLSLGSAEGDAAARVATALDALPDAPIIVVGFDPDIGTYPEIRPTVRVLLADLVARGAQLVVVSLTPEGRALLVAELGRLEAGGTDAATIVDLGYVAGSEAALVSLSRSVRAPGAPGALQAQLSSAGLGAADLIVVVGGNDLGPRTWVEQALPRIDQPPTVAIAPTILLPELVPYVESGQLDALIATPMEGAAYRAVVDPDGDGGGIDRPPDRLALLLGMLVALGVVGHALGARLVPALRLLRRGDRA